MKKSISNSVCLGALIVSSLVVAHCGGDDTGSPGSTAGAGASTGIGAGGSSTGVGGSIGNGGSTTGVGGTVSSGAGGFAGLGGSASTGAGGTATTGAGGTTATGSGGSSNGSFCPATAPMNGTECTPADAGGAANTCVYPGAGTGGADRSCTCQRGVARNDAGMRIDTWACMNVVVRPDAGRMPPPVVDAGLMDMCPANNVANNGNCAQFVTGLMCPGVGGRDCTCRALGMGGGGIKTWNCAVAVPDAGRGGG